LPPPVRDPAGGHFGDPAVDGLAGLAGLAGMAGMAGGAGGAGGMSAIDRFVGREAQLVRADNQREVVLLLDGCDAGLRKAAHPPAPPATAFKATAFNAGARPTKDAAAEASAEAALSSAGLASVVDALARRCKRVRIVLTYAVAPPAMEAIERVSEAPPNAQTHRQEPVGPLRTSK
jgi:hypothetical protein